VRGGVDDEVVLEVVGSSVVLEVVDVELVLVDVEVVLEVLEVEVEVLEVLEVVVP